MDWYESCSPQWQMAGEMHRRRPGSPGAGGRGRRRNAGYTLTGMVAVASIVGISVIGAQEFLGNLSRAPAADPQQMLAAEFAQVELDDLRALDPAEVVSRTTMAKIAGIDYTIASTVSDQHVPQGGKYIRTTVSWLDDRGVPQHYSVEAAQASPDATSNTTASTKPDRTTANAARQ